MRPSAAILSVPFRTLLSAWFQAKSPIRPVLSTMPSPAVPEVAISKLVRELGVGAVPHGFRSSFRDWATECSDAPRKVCELALAHVNTNAIEAAYRRTDLFERRRTLMEHWTAFLARNKDKGSTPWRRGGLQ